MADAPKKAEEKDKTVANKATPDTRVLDKNTSDPPHKDIPKVAENKPAPHTVGDNPAKPGGGTQIPPKGLGSTPPRSDEQAPMPAGTRPNEEEQKNEDGAKGIAEGGVPANDAIVVTLEDQLEAAGSPAARAAIKAKKVETQNTEGRSEERPEDKPLVSKVYGNRPGKILDK